MKSSCGLPWIYPLTYGIIQQNYVGRNVDSIKIDFSAEIPVSIN